MQTIEIKFNNKQIQIIESLKSHNKIFVEGGVRSGKSFLIAWIIDYICYNTPGMIAYVFRKNYEAIKTDTHIIFGQNPGFLTADRGTWKDGKRQFDYFNGSRIYFRHAEDTSQMAGQTAGLIFFEQVEQISKDVFDYAKNTRLSQWGGENSITKQYLKIHGEEIKAGKKLFPRNWMFMTANPSAGWLKGEYIDKDPAREGIKHFHVSTYDNVENLPPEYLADMENASDDFKARFFEGSWQFNSGLVYSEFDNENVVEPPFDLRVKFNQLRTYVAIDPGYSRSKFAVLLAGVLPDGRLYVFDEIVKNGKQAEEWNKVGIPEIAIELKQRYGKFGFIPSQTLIDHASNAKIAGMESISGQFQRLGIHATNAKKNEELDSIFRIKSLLKSKSIIVNSRCVNLIREMGLFRWHEKKLNTTVDEDNDCLDALRYIVNSSPTASIKGLDVQNQFQQEWQAKNVYNKWLKSWYGKTEVKAKGFQNKRTKMDWGV